uniref:Cell division cycle associated 2 n=1 Tax=Paramormyrops kingsleyae TaxID=1676925 RepID=A0A3B3SH70_9TELE
MEDVDVLGQAMAGSPEKNPPLDFSRVTPSLFGISTESFIPSSRKKDKSRLSQLKARRRSTIGVRGSPETNSLIRYIAQQKCRTPPVRPALPPSPFIGHGFSSLRQKMASFQSLLEIDEVPKAELLPAVEWTEVSSKSRASGLVAVALVLSHKHKALSDVPLSTKKRVRFGVPLTPELFDMMLPPSTPLQRGGTPARLIASAGPQLRSLLKTPHRSPQHFPQPDFGSPSETREAPAEMQFDQAEHNRQDDEVFLSVSESEPPSALEEPPIDTAPACSRGRKRKVSQVSAWVWGRDPVTSLPPPPPRLCHSGELWTNQTSKSLTTRERASRTAAVCASQKIKKHWGSKEVDRSLYGKRDYASKNPTLSPISEAVLSASSSPAPQPDHSREQPSGNMASTEEKAKDGIAAISPWLVPLGEMERPALEVPDATPGPRGSDLTASAITAAAMWRKRFCPRTEGPSKVHSDDMAGGTLEEEGPSSGLDQQGSRGCRRRPGVGCMVAIEMEPADGTDEALSISPTHSSGPGNPLEESTQVNSNPHKEGGDADWHMLQECSEPGTDSDTVAPPQVGGSLSEISVNKMIKRSRKRKGWGGNSHRRSGRLQDSQVHMLAEEQMPAQQVPDPSLSGAREEARWEGGAVMGVPSADSSEVSQDAGRTDQGLPWQLPDFSIDDVLQHPSRGRRSVRRSLRNHANTDPSEGGLAWVLETSPDLSVNRSLRRGSKRWTRPTLPEEAGL